MNDAGPEQALQPQLVQRVMMSGLIVRRAHLGGQHSIPAKNHASLIWIVKVSTLGECGATRIVRKQDCLWVVWFPGNPEVKRLDSFCHGGTIPMLTRLNILICRAVRDHTACRADDAMRTWWRTATNGTEMLARASYRS